MPQHRDYSQILDVYPHDYSFTCVGITQKGLRCRQSFILEADKNSAVDILHQMNSHRAWESSFPYLKDLAYLTLCPRWHRKPGYSQVESVSARWRAKITECAVLEITDGLTDSYQTRHNRLHNTQSQTRQPLSLPASSVASYQQRIEAQPRQSAHALEDPFGIDNTQQRVPASLLGNQFSFASRATSNVANTFQSQSHSSGASSYPSPPESPVPTNRRLPITQPPVISPVFTAPNRSNSVNTRSFAIQPPVIQTTSTAPHQSNTASTLNDDPVAVTASTLLRAPPPPVSVLMSPPQEERIEIAEGVSQYEESREITFRTPASLQQPFLPLKNHRMPAATSIYTSATANLAPPTQLPSPATPSLPAARLTAISEPPLESQEPTQTASAAPSRSPSPPQSIPSPVSERIIATTSPPSSSPSPTPENVSSQVREPSPAIATPNATQTPVADMATSTESDIPSSDTVQDQSQSTVNAHPNNPPVDIEYGSAYITPTKTQRRAYLPRTQQSEDTELRYSWFTGHGTSPSGSIEPLLQDAEDLTEIPNHGSAGMSISRSRIERGFPSSRPVHNYSTGSGPQLDLAININMQLSETETGNEKAEVGDQDTGEELEPHQGDQEAYDEKRGRQPGCLRGIFSFRRFKNGFRRKIKVVKRKSRTVST